MTTTLHAEAASRALVRRTFGPFREFARIEASGGILLLACTALALGWANSPWAESYFHLWEVELAIGTDTIGVRQTLHHWINDGLMVIFFFVVGLEIKREVLVGELASLRQAALPIAAALGGIIAPALIYTLFNAGTPGAAGWGIPMATDIAFALGVLALLGPGVPSGLKVFLAALAIVDDIAAVLVIALFYTADISIAALGAAGAIVLLLIVLNLGGIRHPIFYAVFGILLWGAVLASGIHATVAGVVLAMTIPARTRIDGDEFLVRSRAILDEFERGGVEGETILTNSQHLSAVDALENACEEVLAPLLRMEHALHGWVAFFIIPLFALANAGVALGAGALEALMHPVALGVALGLVIGKPAGITLVSWLAVRAGVAAPPRDFGWRAAHGVSWLGGIGFTMSLFIATLAFEGTEFLDVAKIGILIASLIAGTTGWVILRRTIRRQAPAPAEFPAA